MVVDISLLRRVGQLVLHVLLTLIPLALSVSFVRSTRAYLQHRDQDAVHNYRPGTKFFLMVGSATSILYACLSVPRLAAAGILRLSMPAQVAASLGVVAKICAHGLMFRQMFAGPQLSSFLTGQWRCGTKWRPAFGVMLFLSILILAGCEYASFALDLIVATNSKHPCALGLTRWWSALVIGVAGVTTVSSALLVRHTLNLTNGFYAEHVRIFALAVLSGSFKLACALFVWRSDMYPVSGDRDLNVAQNFGLRKDLLPMLVVYIVLFESIWYSSVAPPVPDVHVQSRFERLVIWLKTHFRSGASPDHLQKTGKERKQDARNFPHLYPHLRSIAVDREQCEEDAHRNMLAFASTVRGGDLVSSSAFQVAGGSPFRLHNTSLASLQKARDDLVGSPTETSYQSRLGDLETHNLWNREAILVQDGDLEFSFSEHNPYAIGSHISTDMFDSPSFKHSHRPKRSNNTPKPPLRAQTEQNYRSPVKSDPPKPRARVLSPSASTSNSNMKSMTANPQNCTHSEQKSTELWENKSSGAAATSHIVQRTLSSASGKEAPLAKCARPDRKDPVSPGSCPCDGHKQLKQQRSSRSLSCKRSIFGTKPVTPSAKSTLKRTKKPAARHEKTVGEEIDDLAKECSIFAGKRARSKSKGSVLNLKSPQKEASVLKKPSSTKGSVSGSTPSRSTIGTSSPERLSNGVHEPRWVKIG